MRFAYKSSAALALAIIIFGTHLCVSGEALQPHTLAQIGALLSDKAQRTPAQNKLDSQLLYAAKDAAGQTVPGAPFHRSAITPTPLGKVLIDVEARVSEDLLAQIAKLGGRVVASYPSLNRLRVSMPVLQLETLAARADVKFIQQAIDNPTARIRTDGDDKVVPRGLATVVSEGDKTHAADVARARYAVDGTGLKIGVLSDGVNTVASHTELGTVNILVIGGVSQAGSGDEGTAMLEIVHNLAPGASLYFATGSSLPALAQNIRGLRDVGCNIIIDDLQGCFEDPFQDDLPAQAVADVSGTGVLHFSCADNFGNLKDSTSSTWEGDFSDSGQLIAVNNTNNNGTGKNAFEKVHSFSGTSTVLNGVTNINSTQIKNGTVVLYWSDPLGASTNDYDLFVTNAAGNVLRSSTNVQNGTQNPQEYIGTLNANESLLIAGYNSPAARYFHLDAVGATLAVSTAGCTQGHNACTAPNSFCVAATSAKASFPNAFTGGVTNPVETYSSDGLRRIFYNANGTAITANNFLHTGGLTLNKPEFTAADNVSTPVAGFTSFSGTSAAAPHAGAICALLKSFKPSLTGAQIRNALQNFCLDNEGPGYDVNGGYGILMATTVLQSVQNIGSPSSLQVTPDTETYSEKAQTIVLVATVTPSANEGAVSFQIFNGTTPVGSQAFSQKVLSGNAAAQVVLPGGTPAGTYNIFAQYSGGPTYATSGTVGQLTLNKSQTTTVASASTGVNYSNSDQTVILTATVAGVKGSTVNEGTVAFQLRDQNNFNVGSNTISSKVVNGTVSVSYVVPGGSTNGPFRILAQFSDTPNFIGSGDLSHFVNVKNSVSVYSYGQYVSFSKTAQNVQLSAYTLSNAGIVNAGAIEFLLRDKTPAAAQVGFPVTANVDSQGGATVTYSLPGGTPIGQYSINVQYYGNANYADATDSSGTLQVLQSYTNMTGYDISLAASSKDTPVTLAVNVTSPGGTVNEGTVHFELLKPDNTILGKAVDSDTVANGLATVTYIVPGGTPNGAYEIHAFYSGGPSFSYNSDESHFLTVGKTGLSISSTLSPIPSVTFVGNSISFFVAVSGKNTLVYNWDFGDGTQVTTTTGSVTYSYSVPGTYAVFVTITDPATKNTAFSYADVTITQSIVGIGLDSDNDGFSDDFEKAAGTDPNDASSTPTGSPITKAGTASMAVGAASITVNFYPPGNTNDHIKFTGKILLPGLLNFDALKKLIDVNGAFDNGKSITKSSGGAKNSALSVAMDGNFKDVLAKSNMLADGTKVPVTVTFSVVVGNNVCQGVKKMKYTYDSKKLQGVAK